MDGAQDLEVIAAVPAPPASTARSKATYFFASASEGERSRRIADVGALVAALGVLAISVADHDSTGDSGDRLTELLATLPSIVPATSRWRSRS